MNGTLLLVTGAGRSGTSTVAGALHHLGVHVPGPFLDANASNPRGFYESRWSVEFHNRLLKRANVNITDGRPDALDSIRDAISDRDEERLEAWLQEESVGRPLTVVKDPRSAWTLELWSQVADKLGLRVVHLAMLRHPAEVLGSRATHYLARAPWMDSAGFAVKNLAGWTNAMLITEAQTRGGARAFVRYDDLVGDWRTTMGGALTDLGLDVAISTGPHPVDEFIDPQLSRHRLTWTDHDLPAELRDLAERLWTALDRLADTHGNDDAAATEIEAVRDHYKQMYLTARRLAYDSTQAEVEEARRTAARAARRQPPPPSPLRSRLRSRLGFPKK